MARPERAVLDAAAARTPTTAVQLIARLSALLTTAFRWNANILLEKVATRETRAATPGGQWRSDSVPRFSDATAAHSRITRHSLFVRSRSTLAPYTTFALRVLERPREHWVPR